MTELSTTSSIGVCWPPQPTTQERIRGFYTAGLLDPRNPDDLQAFRDAYDDARARMDAGEATRISLRAVATAPAIRALEQEGMPVEGAMPFGHPRSGLQSVHIPTQEESDAHHHIVYVGENTEERRSSQLWLPPSAEGRCRVITNPAQLDWPFGQEPPVEFRRIEGTANEEQLGLLEQFCELLEPFGYTSDEVQEILEDPSIHIVFAVSPEGRVVSSAMAEIGQLDIGGVGTVGMAEITEAATLPEYRRQGIYRRASGLLLFHLGAVSHRMQIQEYRHLNVIFGESNMHMPAVVEAALRVGRWPVSSLVRSHYGEDLFGADVRRAQGRQPFGVLEQNFRVNDGTVNNDHYNDFMLTPLSYGGHHGINHAAITP